MAAPSNSSDGPCEATIELLSPDGYYKYLDVPKVDTPNTSVTSSVASSANEPLIPPIDADLVKKNYRKLSRKHHPDRPGGNADTFRLLNRAQKVLLNPKLRQQYDILGIDLDDDDEENDGEDDSHDIDKEENNQKHSQRQERPTTAQGIVQEIASMALSTIMQLGVRTRTFNRWICRWITPLLQTISDTCFLFL